MLVIIALMAVFLGYLLVAYLIRELPNLKSPVLKGVLFAGHFVPVILMFMGYLGAILGFFIYGAVLGFFGKVVGLLLQEKQGKP